MPTVVVMDVSASMLRPADPADASTTRQDVAQRGILHLLQHLEKWHEFEPVCMVSMSSACQVLVPFGAKATANHKEVRRVRVCEAVVVMGCSLTAKSQLRTSLYGMHAEDTADVSQALETACSLLDHHYGKDAQGCQVVVVVDGGPSVSEVLALERVLPRLPRSVVMHFVAMGDEEELMHCDLYKTLAQTSQGSYRDVRLPKDIACYKRVFADLATSFFHPYRGTLHCGHLHTPIQLYPDPYLSHDLGNHQAGVGAGGGGGGSVGDKHAGESRSPPLPSLVALRGCIPRDLLVSDRSNEPLLPSFFKVPVASRHVLLPDSRKGEGGGVAAGARKDEALTALPNTLMQALKEAGLVGVCHLIRASDKGDSGAGGVREGRVGGRLKRGRAEQDSGALAQFGVSGGCCFLVPMLMPGMGSGGDGSTDAWGVDCHASLLHLVLVVPVVGDDDDGRIAGTPPLHQLLTTPFASIPHLHPVLGVGADDVGGEAREGKDKKAKKDMSKDLSLPTPDSLESDLHKLLKNVANLPAKKDATYKECERLRRAAQVLQMADIRVALVTLVSSLKADADADADANKERLFYLTDLTTQLAREDPTQPIVAPSYQPGRDKGSASLANLLHS